MNAGWLGSESVEGFHHLAYVGVWGVVNDSRTLKRFWLDLYAQKKPMSGSSTKERYNKTALLIGAGLYENERGENEQK